MSEMNKIIAIHGAFPIGYPLTIQLSSVLAEEDSDLVCQPGVGWMEINQTLKEKGIPLFFPVRANIVRSFPSFLAFVSNS